MRTLWQSSCFYEEFQSNDTVASGWHEDLGRFGANCCGHLISSLAKIVPNDRHQQKLTENQRLSSLFPVRNC